MPLFLRVKRPRGDIPVESFETEQLNKKSKFDSNSFPASTFRYIGSQLTESDANKADFNKLEKVDPHGSFKLLWNATSGKICGTGVSSVPCAIQINHLKRSLPAVEPTESDGTSPTLPAKMMCIISVTPANPSEKLIETFQSATVSKPLERSSNEVDYVYDLYKMERRKTTRVQNCSMLSGRSASSVNPPGFPYPRDEVVFDYEWSDDDRECNSDRVYMDDEDDSNSESNWRNDYPDEDDIVTSESNASCSEQSDSESEQQNNLYPYRFPPM